MAAILVPKCRKLIKRDIPVEMDTRSRFDEVCKEISNHKLTPPPNKKNKIKNGKTSRYVNKYKKVSIIKILVSLKINLFGSFGVIVL